MAQTSDEDSEDLTTGEASNDLSLASPAITPDVAGDSDGSVSDTEITVVELLAELRSLERRSESWQGPLPPPDTISEYDQVDDRFPDAILERFRVETRIREDNAAAVREDRKRRTGLREAEHELRDRESRDDIATRRENRPFVIGGAVVWVVLFVFVLIVPGLADSTRTWVAGGMIVLFTLPFLASMTRGRVGSDNRRVLEAAARSNAGASDGSLPPASGDASRPLPSGDSQV